MTHLHFSELNIWAILVVSVLNMVIGALWYSKMLFGTRWMKELGLSEDSPGPTPILYIVVFILGVILAVVMSMFLQGVSCAWEGLGYGALLSLGVVVPTMLTHFLMEQRKRGIILINIGHELLLFMVYGAILGGWQ